jgi:hypothetical protein
MQECLNATRANWQRELSTVALLCALNLQFPWRLSHEMKLNGLISLESSTMCTQAYEELEQRLLRHPDEKLIVPPSSVSVRIGGDSDGNPNKAGNALLALRLQRARVIEHHVHPSKRWHKNIRSPQVLFSYRGIGGTINIYDAGCMPD